MPLPLAEIAPAIEPTIVTSRPSRIHTVPSPIRILQCQRDQGRRSSRAGMLVSTVPSSPAVDSIVAICRTSCCVTRWRSYPVSPPMNHRPHVRLARMGTIAAFQTYGHLRGRLAMRWTPVIASFALALAMPSGALAAGGPVPPGPRSAPATPRRRGSGPTASRSWTAGRSPPGSPGSRVSGARARTRRACATPCAGPGSEGRTFAPGHSRRASSAHRAVDPHPCVGCRPAPPI